MALEFHETAFSGEQHMTELEPRISIQAEHTQGHRQELNVPIRAPKMLSSPLVAIKGDFSPPG